MQKVNNTNNNKNKAYNNNKKQTTQNANKKNANNKQQTTRKTPRIHNKQLKIIIKTKENKWYSWRYEYQS